MKYNYLTIEAIDRFIDLMIAEDAVSGDHSSLGSIGADMTSRARLIIKDEGILAGVELASRIFQRVDATLKMTTYFHDGDKVKRGDIGFIVEGNSRAILRSERLVLNCMQRMSGIATQTSKIVAMLEGTNTQVLDTRKTTPNFRLAEKWAVKIGGGTNHRYGLSDMIILKDNHIDLAGGIEKAIRSTIAYLKENHLNLRIEVETRTLEEVRQVMAIGGVQVIMLDNMGLETMRKAVEMIGDMYETEASGGITIERVREVALTGVDYISVGALTHSVKSLDISLKVF